MRLVRDPLFCLDSSLNDIGNAGPANGDEQPSDTATDAGNNEGGLLRAPQPTNGKQLADFYRTWEVRGHM